MVYQSSAATVRLCPPPPQLDFNILHKKTTPSKVKMLFQNVVRLHRMEFGLINQFKYSKSRVIVKSNKKSVLSLSNYRFFGVDSARFALASSGTNTDMLLHTPRAQVHQIYYRTKNAKQKGLLLQKSTLSGTRL